MKWTDSSQTELWELPEVEEEIAWIDLGLFVKTEFVVSDLPPKKKSLVLDHFISKFFQTFKVRKNTTNLTVSSRKIEKKKTLFWGMSHFNAKTREEKYKTTEQYLSWT